MLSVELPGDKSAAGLRWSVFILIFFRHIILQHLVCLDLPPLVVGLFDTRDDVRLESVGAAVWERWTVPRNRVRQSSRREPGIDATR
jgi:hypothetical protein